MGLREAIMLVVLSVRVLVAITFLLNKELACQLQEQRTGSVAALDA